MWWNSSQSITSLCLVEKKASLYTHHEQIRIHYDTLDYTGRMPQNSFGMFWMFWTFWDSPMWQVDPHAMCPMPNFTITLPGRADLGADARMEVPTGSNGPTVVGRSANWDVEGLLVELNTPFWMIKYDNICWWCWIMLVICLIFLNMNKPCWIRLVLVLDDVTIVFGSVILNRMKFGYSRCMILFQAGVFWMLQDQLPRTKKNWTWPSSSCLEKASSSCDDLRIWVEILTYYGMVIPSFVDTGFLYVSKWLHIIHCNSIYSVCFNTMILYDTTVEICRMYSHCKDTLSCGGACDLGTGPKCSMDSTESMWRRGDLSIFLGLCHQKPWTKLMFNGCWSLEAATIMGFNRFHRLALNMFSHRQQINVVSPLWNRMKWIHVMLLRLCQDRAPNSFGWKRKAEFWPPFHFCETATQFPLGNHQCGIFHGGWVPEKKKHINTYHIL